MDEVESQKGKVMLLISGYRYRKDKENKDRSTSCRCCEKNGSSGRIKKLDDDILSISEHSHAPEPAKNEALKVVAAVRRRAGKGVEKPRHIIQQVRSRISLKLHHIYGDTQHRDAQSNDKGKTNSFHILIFKI